MRPSQVEQTKLLSNALDRASTGCFTIGIATPLAGYLYNFANIGMSIDLWRLGFGMPAWIIVAVGLHYLARRVLRRLDE